MQVKLNRQTLALGDEQAQTPILWWLREDRGLTGTRYGCGQGVCGACTVHLDGQAVRSCITPCGAADKRELTTIEGLARGNVLHPVQQAWLELAVAQCGYCQSGQIMGAAALLASTPNPSDEQIDAAMAGHLCRCGTYERVRAAIHRAAQIARTGGAR
ncbi:(2Fe-2S)-binding protein [Rhizobacter sp. J219]|jgi:isoquinoline 1-oxidoreductase alpha subunit|uniref:(2Fe-2S)-binding protein n=1 Tax=Rhizobacter sp. J219 TaxID=2898430 RepID=UPI002151F1C1|nr:(2Fe-2S)-binding protein [Rhizobacter sp. J219]MCR5885920.1 (2Fe-2S)-binding protein [Rhizobacter sp. J219]